MIRVLRIIEYQYEDDETMVKDMKNWQYPAHGSINVGSNKKIASTILPSEIYNPFKGDE